MRWDMPDHENQQIYDNFTTILRQFYDNFTPGTATRSVVFLSLPKSLRMKYVIGTARFGTIFRYPTSAGIRSDQNCCIIVVNCRNFCCAYTI